jgi:hypothetical protein
MNILTLPSQERRALVRSFWLTLSMLSLVPWLVLAWWFRAAGFVAAGVVAAALLALIALLHEDVVWRVYRAWNRRLVRPFGSAAARAVMRICYFIVFFAVGAAGSRMPLATRHGASTTWTPRGSLPRDAYRTLFGAASPGGAPGAWIPDYVRWARQTGNLWSVSLLPFLAVLRLLPREGESAPQANIYTLF